MGRVIAAMPLAQRAEAQKPSDDTLKDRIEDRLEVSPLVKKYDLEVKVNMGIAMLTGAVATGEQKAFLRESRRDHWWSPTRSWRRGVLGRCAMRSILLLVLGVPIPIIILIALLTHL